MKRVLTMNKRILVNLLIAVSAVGAIILMIIMNRVIGSIEQQYFPQEGVYGIPFNIGFRWSAVLEMCGAILFQCSLYAMVSCKRKWKSFVCMAGIWLYGIIVFPIIKSNSRIYIMFRLKDWGYGIVEAIRVWDYINLFSYLVLGVICFIFLWKWFDVRPDDGGEKKSIIGRVMIIIWGVCGLALLFLKSFTNPWYLGLCGLTCAAVWFLLGLLEKKWAQWKIDSFPRRKKSIMDLITDRLLGLDDDDADDVDDVDEVDDVEMTKYTLELLLTFADKLEAEPLDDKTKKEYMVRMIRKLRDNYD